MSDENPNSPLLTFGETGEELLRLTADRQIIYRGKPVSDEFVLKALLGAPLMLQAEITQLKAQRKADAQRVVEMLEIVCFQSGMDAAYIYIAGVLYKHFMGIAGE